MRPIAIKALTLMGALVLWGMFTFLGLLAAWYLGDFFIGWGDSTFLSFMAYLLVFGVSILMLVVLVMAWHQHHHPTEVKEATKK